MEAYLTVWHCVYVLISVPTILGNGLILLSIIRYKCLRTNMHILIGNLALSDLIFGIILIPVDLIGDIVGLNHIKVYCISKLALFVLSLGGSCYSLLLISVERFFAIAFPLTRRNWLTKCKVVWLIVYGWIHVSLTGFLPLFGWNQYDDNQTHCDSDHIYTRGYQQFISIQFIVVLTANIVLYAIVMRIAMKTAKCRRIMDSVTIHNRSERDFQKLKMMAIVLGLFIVCWSPYTVIVTILLLYHYNSTLRFARKCSLILGIINSALNWMVYGFRNKDFKTAFKEIIKCQRNNAELSFVSRAYTVPAVSSKQPECEEHSLKLTQSTERLTSP